MTIANATRLEHGGVTREPTENSVPLIAASYTHPVLTNHSIVRLIPEALVDAEDITLGVTGLIPQGRVNVGHTRRRAIGFPAWPILTDPDNAQHALNLIADLERAGRLARTKPRRFKESVDKLATKLDNSAPHFLPTFLEEAGRMLIAADNARLAAQMFTAAREAEQRHRLLIDEDRHLAAVKELAYAGALSTKELSNEAKRLAESMEPLEAYKTYRTLCAERVHAGLSPHAGMKKELARLATAAGLNVADEEARLAQELLVAPSIEHAGAHFWRNYGKAISRIVAEDTALMDRLLAFSPRGMDTDPWLDVLEKTGALDVVKQGNHPDFIPRILLFETRWKGWSKEGSKKLASVLTQILPHAGLTQVPFPHGALRFLPAGIVESVVASGVSFEFSHPSSFARIDLEKWARLPSRDPLPHLAADTSLRVELATGVWNVLEYPEVMDVLAADPHLRPVLLELITERVEELEAGIPPLDLLSRNTRFLRGFEHVRDADFQTLLDRARAIHRDLAVPVAESLRQGLPDELGWPELEQTLKDYGEPQKLQTWMDCTDSWPGVFVKQNSGITYLRGRTATPIANWTGESVFGVEEVDGQFGLSTYHTNNPRVWWPQSPQAKVSTLHEFGNFELHASVPVPGGRLFGAGVIMRPGHSTWASGSEHFFVDGERIWLVDGTTVVEIDPATGKKGRASLPDWLEEQCRRHPDLVLNPRRSQHRPVTDVTAGSPFSTADGYHRHAVFTRPDDPDFCLLVDADGTEYTITGSDAASVRGALRRPDGGTWIFAGSTVLDPQNLRPIPVRGISFKRDMWWHHTRIRDAAVSRRLRSLTADDVRPLVDYARSENTKNVSKGLCGAVGDLFDLTDPVLRYSIARLVHDAARSWPQPEEAADASGEQLTPAPTFARQRHLLKFGKQFRLEKFDIMDIWRDTRKLGLHELYVPPLRDQSRMRLITYDWMYLLGHGDALLALAAVPGRTAEEVQALKELWTVLRDAGALSATNLVLESYDFPLLSTMGGIKLPPQALERGYRSLEDTYNIVRADSTEPVTKDGKAVQPVHREEIPPSRTDLESVFDALIDQINAEGRRPWSPEAGEAFAAATGAPLADAHLLMAGFPNFSAYEVNFLPKELRTAMGLKVAEAKAARQHLEFYTEHFLGVLAKGVPEDSSTLLTCGLDATAMAQYWSEHGPTYLPELPAHIAERIPKTFPESAVQLVAAGEHDEDDSPQKSTWALEVPSLLWLAAELDLADPLRASLADYAEELHTTPRGISKICIASEPPSESNPTLRPLVGVPERTPGDESEQIFQSGRLTLEQLPSLDKVYVDLSDVSDPDDPIFALALERTKETFYERMVVSAAMYRARGTLTAYAAWLRQSGEGEPRDPLVSVPDLVSTVADTYNVSEDAARYYLQLLAWSDPTDANVRRWNSWKKADITRAGKELVAADLVATGKRPRSGREFFLKGGWIDNTAPELPIELWKASAFKVETTDDSGHYSTPFKIPVSPLPPPEWFAACWERSQGDDAPEFAELKTTRRRRR